MASESSQTILIAGAGPMAIAYAKALQGQKRKFIAVGRGEKSAQAFTEQTGVPALTGGLDAWLAKRAELPLTAIVAMPEMDLGQATLKLLGAGVRKVLVEKPGAFRPSEIRQVEETAKLKAAEVYVGYNRRFHASTQAARRMIADDGGTSSFHFEFTEWGHVVEKKICPEGVHHEWFLHNSSHVVDLAFYLGGWPEEISSYHAGKLPWHPRASKYAGAGRTREGALFSYHANWGAPGRWSVEILSSKNRYIFKPLEKLQIQKLGSVAVEEVALEDALDKDFKPGVYRQVEAFLADDRKILPTISEQISHLPIYEKMEDFG